MCHTCHIEPEYLYSMLTMVGSACHAVNWSTTEGICISAIKSTVYNITHIYTLSVFYTKSVAYVSFFTIPVLCTLCLSPNNVDTYKVLVPFYWPCLDVGTLNKCKGGTACRFHVYISKMWNQRCISIKRFPFQWK